MIDRSFNYVSVNLMILAFFFGFRRREPIFQKAEDAKIMGARILGICIAAFMKPDFRSSGANCSAQADKLK
ncbi:hypothetical protein, partial [uncultured Dubosiella sp.]|uniref:hypothetical protein n=1 Tax=uncultured Dubosiella sp. TaxID=1937011 RepID=UPI0026260E8A